MNTDQPLLFKKLVRQWLDFKVQHPCLQKLLRIFVAILAVIGLAYSCGWIGNTSTGACDDQHWKSSVCIAQKETLQRQYAELDAKAKGMESHYAEIHQKFTILRQRVVNEVF